MVVILELNRITRGWANYFRPAPDAKRAFRDIDGYLWWRMWRWLRAKHRQRNAQWVKRAYYHVDPWWPSARDGFWITRHVSASGDTHTGETRSPPSGPPDPRSRSPHLPSGKAWCRETGTPGLEERPRETDPPQGEHRALGRLLPAHRFGRVPADGGSVRRQHGQTATIIPTSPRSGSPRSATSRSWPTREWCPRPAG